jgi:hypothetical protein
MKTMTNDYLVILNCVSKTNDQLINIFTELKNDYNFDILCHIAGYKWIERPEYENKIIFYYADKPEDFVILHSEYMKVKHFFPSTAPIILCCNNFDGAEWMSKFCSNHCINSFDQTNLVFELKKLFDMYCKNITLPSASISTPSTTSTTTKEQQAPVNMDKTKTGGYATS